MLNLQTIQDYYEQKLTNKLFQYTLGNGQTIQIRFYLEAFCHLLGIQHIPNNRRYIGKSNYPSIYSLI